eukprot:1657592-Prorocentrum_lima.AAC.1
MAEPDLQGARSWIFTDSPAWGSQCVCMYVPFKGEWYEPPGREKLRQIGLQAQDIPKGHIDSNLH